MLTRLGIIILLIYLTSSCYSQDTVDLIPISSKFLEGASKKASRLEKKLERKSAAAIVHMKREEERIARKLFKTDSTKARELLADSEKKYRELQYRLDNYSEGKYIPSLDTISTSLRFLQQNPQLTRFDSRNPARLKEAVEKMDALGARLNKADEIKKFLKDRKKQILEKLKGSNLARNLRRINKEVYYFGEQIREYKSLLSDHRKAERKAFELLSRTKQFKDFMRKHSGLASLFRMPGSSDEPSSMANLAGLQTRSQVNSLIQQQIAAGGPAAQAQFRQNVQDAQSQLNQLKAKVKDFGGSGSDQEMPDGFKPNSNRVKNFWRRLELGTNIQSQKGNSFLPVTTDLAFTIGYKLNDRSVVGVGGSYRMGWGRGLQHIKISHEGIGLRSFIDWKIKGSFWLTGGYERNYLWAFRNMDQLRLRSAWVENGVVGVSKVISIKSGFLKKSKVQLLWNFLATDAKFSQPIIFRIAYCF